MYKCDCCGELFDEPIVIRESRGEYWGFPCYEELTVSPCCKDSFEESKTFYAEGKVYALIDGDSEMTEVADFSGEYSAENDGEALYDVILTEQMTKWNWKFGDYIDIDIELYWE